MAKIKKEGKWIIIIVLTFLIYNLYTGGLQAVVSPDSCAQYYINWEGKCKQKFDCQPINTQTGFCGACQSREVSANFCETSQEGSSTTEQEESAETTQPTTSYTSINTFSLRWIDRPTKAVKDDLVTMEINVKNTGTNFGSMKVQCSILDPEVNTWLQAAIPVVVDNCVAGEPFTQTKIVELDRNQNVDVSFTVAAPHEEGTYRLYCAAYEYCYSEEQEALVSDDLTQDDIEIIGEECTETTTWMKLRGKECVDNKIVDMGEEPKEKFNFDEWIKENRIAVLSVLVVLFIVFMIWIFEEPKQPQLQPTRKIYIRR